MAIKVITQDLVQTANIPAPKDLPAQPAHGVQPPLLYVALLLAALEGVI